MGGKTLLERLRDLKLTFFIVPVLSFFLISCSGGGGGSGGTGGETGGSTSGTPITDSGQASQVTSTGTQAVNMVQGIGGFMNVTGGLSGYVGGPAAPEFKFSSVFYEDPGLAKAKRLSAKLVKSKALRKAGSALKKAKSMKAPVPISGSDSCTDGGSFSYSGTYDDQTGNFNVTFTFNNCREDDSQRNGPMKMQGTMQQNGMTMNTTFGDPQTQFTMLEFANNYATLVSKMIFDNFTMEMNRSQSGNTENWSTTMNGGISIYDYIANEDYSMQFNNYQMNISGTCTDQFCNDYSSLDATVNGGFTETWNNGQNSVALNYSEFRLTEELTQTYEEWSVDGTLSVDFTPDECFEGTYVFETIEPFRVENGQTVAGHMTINTYTHTEVTSAGIFTVWFDANGNGSMDSGEIITETDDLSEIAQVCDFYTFNEEAPVSSGTGGTATGDTMTITSKSVVYNSTDPNNPMADLYCYTDIHVNYVSDVNYYNTPPDALPQGVTKWYVDYHQQDSSNPDVDGDGIDDFEQYLDITGDGIADVGLDINGSEMDYTSGGLEHFKALVLPAGYYVVSMNNYSCDPNRVKNEVTISVGERNIFGPYICEYTSADSETDHDPGAWCAIADIVVDSNGNVTVKDHDPNLELWHDGAFGFYFYDAPKKAKGLRK